MYRGQCHGAALARQGGVPVPAGHPPGHTSHTGHGLLPGSYQGAVEVFKVGGLQGEGGSYGRSSGTFIH